MSVEILMPELGESVHEGTVSRWLKQEGESVKEDEPIVEIMTDKVNTELPSPASGILSKILIPEGSPVEVFKAMGIIEEENGKAKKKASDNNKKDSKDAKKEEVAAKEAPQAKPEPAKPAADGDKKWYTPVVRAMAKEHSLSEADLANVSGSGEGGRVTKKDVEAYIAGGGRSSSPSLEFKSAEPVKAGPDQEVTQLAGMRKMIADHMVRSAAIPTVSTVQQVDVSTMVSYREHNKEIFQKQYGVKLTYMPFFMKALTDSLMEYPIVNSSLQGDQLVTNNGVHLGVAVALGEKGDQGLIVPVVKDCHKKNLVDLAKDMDAIAKKARSSSLSVDDVKGGTFTLTNAGSYGALFGTPMINAPQAGILGTYGIQKMPVIMNDMIAIRSIMHIVLTYDHRLVDGLVAGKFLASVRDRLQNFDFFK